MLRRGWWSLRAAGREGERGAVVDWAAGGREGGDSWGLGCSIQPSARLSRCVPGELGSWEQGLRRGHHHRWCRVCIHGDGQAVGVTAAGSPGWNGLDHIGSRHNRVDWRWTEGGTRLGSVVYADGEVGFRRLWRGWRWGVHWRRLLQELEVFSTSTKCA